VAEALRPEAQSTENVEEPLYRRKRNEEAGKYLTGVDAENSEGFDRINRINRIWKLPMRN
jgi:hypothetical protein